MASEEIEAQKNLLLNVLEAHAPCNTEAAAAFFAGEGRRWVDPSKRDKRLVYCRLRALEREERVMRVSGGGCPLVWDLATPERRAHWEAHSAEVRARKEARAQRQAAREDHKKRRKTAYSEAAAVVFDLLAQHLDLQVDRDVYLLSDTVVVDLAALVPKELRG